MQDVQSVMPDVATSLDVNTCLCDETDDEHDDTTSLMNFVQHDMACVFAHSNRQKTLAHRRHEDNVPKDVKSKRLQEITHAFRTNAQLKNEKFELHRILLLLV